MKTIYEKIDDKSLTVDDLQSFINEAYPEAIRNRIRRRTTVDSGEPSEIKFADRVQPKKRRGSNSQKNGISKAAHRKSTRTQRRKAKAKKVQNESEVSKTSDKKIPEWYGQDGVKIVKSNNGLSTLKIDNDELCRQLGFSESIEGDRYVVLRQGDIHIKYVDNRGLKSIIDGESLIELV